MLTDLTPQPPDKILKLMQIFRDDPRTEKIDLGVGVYRNAEGVTPVMRAVKAAERSLAETQETKSYTNLSGDPAFCHAMRELLLKDSIGEERVAIAATPGGTGAIRQGLELMRYADRASTAWFSSPTWPNHLTIASYLGVPMREYRYFDNATRDVDFDGMIEDLKDAKSGDLVVLHGCCHNPTGANLTVEQWETLAELLAETGAVPFVDIAYQGFGDGLDEGRVRHASAGIANARDADRGELLEEFRSVPGANGRSGRDRSRCGFEASGPGYIGIPQPAELLLPAGSRSASGPDDSRQP